MKNKFLLIASIIFFTILQLELSAKGYLAGTISEADTKKPLAGATVRLEGTAFGAVTNKNGSFHINTLDAGNYNILVSFIGYETKKLTIVIKDNDSTKINIELKEQALQTGAVVVSANKRIQAVQDVPITVSVIGSREIQERNIGRIDEVLQYAPGVTLVGDNISIRGSSGFTFGTGSRVAYLIDGFPMLAGDAGDVKFDIASIYNIDHIEIVKGAGSALYGTGALGGVINIITKDPSEKPDLRIRAYSGIYTKPKYTQWRFMKNGYPTKNGTDLTYSQKIGNLGMMFSSGIRNDISYKYYGDYYTWNILSKLSYDFTEQLRITLLGNYTDDNRTDWVFWRSLDSATFPPASANISDRIRSKKLSVSGDIRWIIDNQNFLDNKSSYYNTDFHSTLDINDPQYRGSTANSYNDEIQMNTRLGQNTLFTYGVMGTFNDVKSPKTYGNHQQDILAVYLQSELVPLDKLTLTLGGRLDYEKTSQNAGDKQFSPKAGLSYISSWGPTFRASAGRGFRAPTIGERFATATFSGFHVAENLDLRPEESWSFEIGSNYEFKISDMIFQYDASLFQNEFYNLIEPGFISSGEIKFQNITRARIQGIEVSLKALPLKFLAIETSITALNPRDLTLNQELKYRNNIMWYTSLIFPLDYVELRLDYRYMSRMTNVDSLLRFYVSDFDERVPVHIVDLSVGFNLKKIADLPVTFTFNAKNLLDYYYTYMVANLAPTRYINIQADIAL